MFLKELLCNLVLDGNIQNVLVSVQIFELATGFIKKKKKQLKTTVNLIKSS